MTTEMTTDMAALTQAVQRYFDLMYDGDVADFDAVFHTSAQLHGFRAGGLITAIPAAAYRDMLSGTPSPRSQGAPRQQEILLLDIAAADQALAKVRVRINAILYLDYLCYHCIDQRWLITAKSFHVEARL
ncbi:MAG: nuclear transport factor 2 family protein [Ferrovibrio sp.]|uniref:nuclear transport factor 2 family protein n=1 Tax=Ferrovibrio sp. TaxID=1917215 RepID=UPI00260A29E5|nr:nuclear transport factor 2 family protein [Ferrovibrio sp.]MCW0235428.1 nuclear transport factor 2 family protein [Ferrovibrio sp.]